MIIDIKNDNINLLFENHKINSYNKKDNKKVYHERSKVS
jgi:hypothetical protein